MTQIVEKFWRLKTFLQHSRFALLKNWPRFVSLRSHALDSNSFLETGLFALAFWFPLSVDLVWPLKLWLSFYIWREREKFKRLKIFLTFSLLRAASLFKFLAILLSCSLLTDALRGLGFMKGLSGKPMPTFGLPNLSKSIWINWIRHLLKRKLTKYDTRKTFIRFFFCFSSIYSINHKQSKK